jgi:hypothetical protein
MAQTLLLGWPVRDEYLPGLRGCWLCASVCAAPPRETRSDDINFVRTAILSH